MSCPFFVDCTRECVKEIRELPADTFDFCTTQRHVDCPFYRSIRKIGPFCERIPDCSVYNLFRSEDFQAFVKMTREFCLSTQNATCQRYILKKSGSVVPPDLLPDGKRIQR